MPPAYYQLCRNPVLHPPEWGGGWIFRLPPPFHSGLGWVGGGSGVVAWAAFFRLLLGKRPQFTLGPNLLAYSEVFMIPVIQLPYRRASELEDRRGVGPVCVALTLGLILCFQIALVLWAIYRH
jgi:hypothetical protein